DDATVYAPLDFDIFHVLGCMHCCLCEKDYFYDFLLYKCLCLSLRLLEVEVKIDVMFNVVLDHFKLLQDDATVYAPPDFDILHVLGFLTGLS
ncbi:hypothetical protein Tco_1297697, partial [Tanacetum coccineum]